MFMKAKITLLLLLVIILKVPIQAQRSALIKNQIIPEIENALEQDNTSNLIKWVSKLYLQDTILPDESAYFLGTALFKSNKPNESKIAYLRYIDLTKEKGKYFLSTVDFVNKIDKELKQEDQQCDICKVLGPLTDIDTCNICKGYGKLKDDCSRCNGIGRESCPTCFGTGFERIPSGFQINFLPCTTCNRNGYIDCISCEGTKKEVQFCENCNGNGVSPKPRQCTHQKNPKIYFYR